MELNLKYKNVETLLIAIYPIMVTYFLFLGSNPVTASFWARAAARASSSCLVIRGFRGSGVCSGLKMYVGVGPRNPYFARRLGQVFVRKKCSISNAPLQNGKTPGSPSVLKAAHVTRNHR